MKEVYEQNKHVAMSKEHYDSLPEEERRKYKVIFGVAFPRELTEFVLPDGKRAHI